MNANDMIRMINDETPPPGTDEPVSKADRLYMALLLVDWDAVKKEVALSGMMAQMGMTTPKLSDQLAYILLCVFRPETPPKE